MLSGRLDILLYVVRKFRQGRILFRARIVCSDAEGIMNFEVINLDLKIINMKSD